MSDVHTVQVIDCRLIPTKLRDYLIVQNCWDILNGSYFRFYPEVDEDDVIDDDNFNRELHNEVIEILIKAGVEIKKEPYFHVLIHFFW